jgi:hypothetical protein
MVNSGALPPLQGSLFLFNPSMTSPSHRKVGWERRATTSLSVPFVIVASFRGGSVVTKAPEHVGTL